MAIAALDDGPPSLVVNASRRTKLRQYRDAWKMLKWTSRKSLAIHGRCWELVGGVLGFSLPDGRGFLFTQIPSIIRGIHGEEWQLDAFDFDIEDFTMDPSQDLLVTIEAKAKQHVCVLFLVSAHRTHLFLAST